jgi:hypothetical protein
LSLIQIKFVKYFIHTAELKNKVKKLERAAASARLLKKVDITAIKQKQMLCGENVKSCCRLSSTERMSEKTNLKSTIFLHIFGSDVFIIS